MKFVIMLILFSLPFGTIAQMVNDHDLIPQCAAFAKALADDQTSGNAGEARLVDIYVVDLSTINEPTKNKTVLVEEYTFENLPGRPVFTEQGNSTPTNPNGYCHAFQVN